MPFIKLSLFIFLLIFTCHLHASGGGGGEGEGKAEKEGPAEGAGDGDSKDYKEYQDKLSKMNLHKSRIEEADRVFKELVEKKNAAKTTQEKQVIVNQMVEVTKNRDKDVDLYNSFRIEVSTRYPGEGKKFDRRYKIETKRSVEEMEGVSGLEEKLNRVHQRIETKFAPFKTEEEKAQPAPQVKTHEEKPKRLRIEK